MSDSIGGSDAVAIKGAVGSAWRVDLNSEKGTKYYFVTISNSAEVYSRSLSVQNGKPSYVTLTNSITLNPVAMQMTGSDSSPLGMIALTTVSVIAVLMIAAGVVLIIKKQRDNSISVGSESYYDAAYSKNNKAFSISSRSSEKSSRSSGRSSKKSAGNYYDRMYK